MTHPTDLQREDVHHGVRGRRGQVLRLREPRSNSENFAESVGLEIEEGGEQVCQDVEVGLGGDEGEAPGVEGVQVGAESGLSGAAEREAEPAGPVL